jgi:hypothetical protein
VERDASWPPLPQLAEFTTTGSEHGRPQANVGEERTADEEQVMEETLDAYPAAHVGVQDMVAVRLVLLQDIALDTAGSQQVGRQENVDEFGEPHRVPLVHLRAVAGAAPRPVAHCGVHHEEEKMESPLPQAVELGTVGRVQFAPTRHVKLGVVGLRVPLVHVYVALKFASCAMV